MWFNRTKDMFNNCLYILQLKNMFPIMNDVSNKMTAYIRNQLEKKPDGFELKNVSFFKMLTHIALTTNY